MATKAEVAPVRHVTSVASPTCKVSAQHGARNVINVETRTISVLVVDPSQRAKEMARKAPMAGAGPRDHEAKVDALNPDLEANQG